VVAKTTITDKYFSSKLAFQRPSWQEICKQIARVNVVASKRNGAYAQNIQPAALLAGLRAQVKLAGTNKRTKAFEVVRKWQI
jgi:hypothetical protein